ncbi:MAG: cellulose synthase family protein, partial [Spartobacteria bacterium]
MSSPFADIIQSQAVWTIAYLAVLLGLSIYGLHRYSIIHFFLKHRNASSLPSRRFEELPCVTIQLPVFNEYHVVGRLLDSVAAIDYPGDRLEIQVLDDSTDETLALCREKIAALQAMGLDISHIHRTDRSGYKAGALENGLRTARGEFIFILDADFVPAPDILHKLIHHFTDAKTGMVQARWGHLNANASLLTRLQAVFLDGHLLLEQTARSRSGRFFNFNGTAGMWRRSCIEDAGGWEHDTLTEDLDLSYRAQLRGWRFVFLPDVEVPAELPEDIDGFKSQQHRWTKGSIQTCLKLLPAVWRSRIPLALKFEATIHLTSNFGYLLLVLLCLLTLPQTRTEAGLWRTLLVDIPIFLATTVSIVCFYAIAMRHLNPRGWIKNLTLMPGLLALAIGMSVNNARGVLEAIFKKQSEFTRTPKRGDRAVQAVRYVPARTWVPVIEAFFAAYFLICLVDACLGARWTSVPFMALFVGGFVYVSALSLAARWRPLRLWPATSSANLEALQKTSFAILVAPMLFLGGCATDMRHQMIISAADQKMVVIRDGKPSRTYP